MVNNQKRERGIEQIGVGVGDYGGGLVVRAMVGMTKGCLPELG